MASTSASRARIAASPDRRRSASPILLNGPVSAVSLTATSPRPHPEEPPKAASRRTGAAPCFETRTACAPQHEAEIGRPRSYPPAHEDVLVELGPVLVFANVIRPVGEIETLKLGARARFPGVGPRRVVAELLIEHLSIFRHQEIHEQHGGVRMRRLAGDG